MTRDLQKLIEAAKKATPSPEHREEQRRSLVRLLDHDFEWVFAGHGGSHGETVDEMKRRLRALVERMK